MTEVAGGPNEAKKLLHRNISLTTPYLSTASVVVTKLTEYVEDGEHFGEVGLRLTPRLGREMRLTIIILRMFASASTNNGRLHINSEIQSITYHLSISLTHDRGCWRPK